MPTLDYNLLICWRMFYRSDIAIDYYEDSSSSSDYGWFTGFFLPDLGFGLALTNFFNDFCWGLKVWRYACSIILSFSYFLLCSSRRYSYYIFSRFYFWIFYLIISSSLAFSSLCFPNCFSSLYRRVITYSVMIWECWSVHLHFLLFSLVLV